MWIAGYVGSDCSLAASSPPTVLSSVSGPTCETSVNNKCDSVRMIVDNFDMKTSVVCKVVSVQCMHFAVYHILFYDVDVE